MKRKSNRARTGTKKVTSFGSRVIQGLTELAEVLERGEAIEKRFTVRTIRVRPPKSYAPSAIRRIRVRLGASQAIFAQIVGVSVKLIEHWESGRRVPSTMACRLLDDIDSNPTHWRQKLRAA